MTAADELKQLRKLLKIEKEEDLQQYKRFVMESDVKERVKNGSSWYPVMITQTGIGRGEQVFVELERTTNKNSEHQLQTGRRAALFCNANNKAGKMRTEGVIGTSTKDRLRIYLTTDELPEWIRDGKIGIDMLFDETSYREMDETLRLVSDAEKNRLAELREILLGHQPSFSSERSDYKVEIAHLNASQNQAVAAILASKDIAIVHGPPGTYCVPTSIEKKVRLGLKGKVCY